jgi:hypothetical protein
MKIQLNDRPVLRKLDDGLILCRSRREDAEALAEFNARIHSDEGFDKPDVRVAAWTRDLLARPHPTFHADDCWYNNDEAHLLLSTLFPRKPSSVMMVN